MKQVHRLAAKVVILIVLSASIWVASDKPKTAVISIICMVTGFVVGKLNL